MAGLATLNKAPGIILTLAAVALLGWYAWRDRHAGRGWFWRWVNDALVWSGAAVLVGVALWPAMWNSAAFAIRRVAEGALRQASNPHEKGNFSWASAWLIRAGAFTRWPGPCAPRPW